MIDFISDSATSFLVHSPELLLYRLGVCLNGELMANNLGVDSGYIGGRPREYIWIFWQELFEQCLLVRVQAWADTEGQLGVTWVYPECLGILLGLIFMVSWLSRWVWILAFVVLWLLLIDNSLLLLVYRRVFVKACSGGLLRPARPLSSYCSYHPSHCMATSDVGHSRWCGVFQ